MVAFLALSHVTMLVSVKEFSKQKTEFFHPSLVGMMVGDLVGDVNVEATLTSPDYFSLSSVCPHTES